MYKEVAFDPQCLREYHYYGLLKSAFGQEKGRYVVAAFNEWLKEAISVVKYSNIQDVKKKSIKNYLNNIRKNRDNKIFLLPLDRKAVLDSTEGVDWYQWFSTQKEYMNFDVTVSERDIDEAISYENIIDECDVWNVPATVRVERTPQDIVDVLLPVIRFGSYVVLIDQFFKLAGNKVLHELLKCISDMQNVKSLKVVTSIDTDGPCQVFDKEYKKIYQYLPKIELVIAPERFFHDRYLITDNSAVKAGQGFSDAPKSGRHADKLSINICGEDEKKDTEVALQDTIDREISKVIELNS